MDDLTIDIERCFGGVELVDNLYRCCTDRVGSERLVLVGLEIPIVVAFVNASGAERGAELWVHGGGDSLRRDYVLKDRSRFLSRNAGGENATATLATVNAALAKPRKFNLQPAIQLGLQGTPRLLLKSDSLIGFMLMEIAMVVLRGARPAESEQCGALF
jgi:hypothetical protein